MKKYNSNSADEHFRKFASSLEQTIARYGKVPEGDLFKLQKKQVENLVKLETKFRRALIKHAWGPGVYKSFVAYICDERKNILAARPFFRERQGVFTSKISKALKKRQAKGLYSFRFNYEFVLFVMRSRKWHPSSEIAQLAKQIQDQRWALVEMNMPLAISRARIFWSRTPKAQLSYMDLVQITALGLMSGIDKFCLPYSQAFRSTVIGRMVGNLIEQYSETLVHFFPVDKRKIYRANKVISKFGENPDFEKLAAIVNLDVDKPHRTNAAELAQLMAASSTVSADTPISGSDNDPGESPNSMLDGFAADEEAFNPEHQAEQKEAFSAIANAIPQLSMIEQKVLRLRGVSL